MIITFSDVMLVVLPYNLVVDYMMFSLLTLFLQNLFTSSGQNPFLQTLVHPTVLGTLNT